MTSQLEAANGSLADWHLRDQLRRALRAFFDQRNYLEVDPPVAVPCPGTETHLRYFATTWVDESANSHQLYLRSSPELHLKRLLSTGIEKVWTCGPCFRNHGECADWHRPEFTMLEWYECGVTLEQFIGDTLELLRATQSQLQPHIQAAKLAGRPLIGDRIERRTIAELWREVLGIDLHEGDPELANRLIASGVESVSCDDDFDTAYFKAMLDRVEPHLGKLGVVVVQDYLPSHAALAKVQDGVAKRFEIYVDGIELCNGFLELTDRAENHSRYQAAMAQRRSEGVETPPYDSEFGQALQSGLPASCGNALGFDRWLALLRGDSNLAGACPQRTATGYRQLEGLQSP